ncbi:superinfection exclusion protein [Escherichia coli]|uniref:superinfection exclusion protein n=2 Tax=Escherichia coli TaxID=562 RepID=UPI001FCEF9BE|nr:superinfection exclusion protein [Escherichia coli]
MFSHPVYLFLREFSLQDFRGGSDYDAFQYDNNIKPDYCNANGLEMWDESLTDEDLSEMGLTDRWVDWYSECQCYDDPRKYLESLKEETSAA